MPAGAKWISFFSAGFYSCPRSRAKQERAMLKGIMVMSLISSSDHVVAFMSKVRSMSFTSVPILVSDCCSLFLNQLFMCVGGEKEGETPVLSLSHSSVFLILAFFIKGDSVRLHQYCMSLLFSAQSPHSLSSSGDNVLYFIRLHH